MNVYTDHDKFDYYPIQHCTNGVVEVLNWNPVSPKTCFVLHSQLQTVFHWLRKARPSWKVKAQVHSGSLINQHVVRETCLYAGDEYLGSLNWDDKKMQFQINNHRVADTLRKQAFMKTRSPERAIKLILRYFYEPTRTELFDLMPEYYRRTTKLVDMLKLDFSTKKEEAAKVALKYARENWEVFTAWAAEHGSVVAPLPELETRTRAASQLSGVNARDTLLIVTRENDYLVGVRSGSSWRTREIVRDLHDYLSPDQILAFTVLRMQEQDAFVEGAGVVVHENPKSYLLFA